MLRITVFIILMSLTPGILIGQEICDNGIDDDGDGLIDLNDDDCICLSFIESSLIPNPSFEEKTCCPTANEMLHCAVGWIQASAPTTDYVHTCGGYLGNTNIPARAPLPFPDGDGGVGFRDGQTFVGPNYKEYVGACLQREMTIGKTYRLDFFVGFQNNVQGSNNLKLGIFGSNDCRYLPFGGGSSQIGCPVNTGRYKQLAEIDVSGNNGWTNVVVDFTADDAYEVIVLGPGCGANPNYRQDPYFFIDRLALEEIGKFGVPLDSIDGSICQNDLVIAVSNDTGRTYQWYKDGIALVGETMHRLVLQNGPNVEGVYIVTITSSEGCFLSQEYTLRVPPYYAPFDTIICDEDVVDFGGELFSDSGYYEITIPAKDGCDSIIQLSLSVNPNTAGILLDTFCQGDIYSKDNIQTNQDGIYLDTLVNHLGCDNFVELRLTMIESANLIDIESTLSHNLGDVIDIIPDWVAPGVEAFEWTSASGSILSTESQLSDFLIVDNTTIFLKISDQHGCSHTYPIEIRVNKENTRIFVPNVFTPNGDNLNDIFTVFSTQALARINSCRVYDRWGELVFQSTQDLDAGDFKGWDGTLNGKQMPAGVYTYVLAAKYLDGSEEMVSGDVTLIR